MKWQLKYDNVCESNFQNEYNLVYINFGHLK